MKSVLNIARAELRYMATSPIAWGVSCVLILLFAKDYISVLSSYVSQLEKGRSMDGLTYFLAVQCPSAAFIKLPILMKGKFVLPFLFMGVISREFSSGTIRLIQSSPVSVRSFVFGKFLGLMGYSAVIVAIYALITAFLCFSVVAPEVGLLAWGLMVLLLYFFFIASVCLFASSLSSYALVGGIVSIVLIIGTNLLNNVGQATAWGDFFYPLSHQAMAERLISGGIDWNDILLLLIMTLLFIVLTIVHLQNKARNLSQGKRTLRFGLAIAAAFVLMALLPYTPINFTDIRRGEMASVHPNMQQILGELNHGPLEVTHYFNVIFNPDMRRDSYIPEGQPKTKYDVWRPYMRHKKDIHVNVKYYYAIDTADYYTRMIVKAYAGKSDWEIAQIMADAYGFPKDRLLTLEEAQQEVDITGNEYIGHIIKLNYQDRSSQLLVPGMYMPSDRHYYAAMERLVSGRGKELFFVRDGKPREIYYRTEESQYLTNKQNELLSPDNWQQIGPPQDSIRLEREDIPVGAKAMVLLGPRQSLTEEALQKIKQFVDDGGNLLVAGEPEYRDYVKPLMDYLGVSMKPTVIVQPMQNRGSASVLGAFTPESYAWSHSLQRNKKRNEFFCLSPDTANLIFNGVAGLDISGVKGFEVTPLLNSRAGRSWNKPVVNNFDSLQLILDKNPSDEDGSFPLMALLHRDINGRQQRIVVTGDVDFVKGPQVYSSVTNEWGLGSGFTVDILALLTNDELPVYLERPFLPDKAFRITTSGVGTQSMLLIYVLPALLVAGGGYTIVRRRRK